MSRARVVITGLGVISPLGMGINNYWENYLCGINPLSKITLFSTEKFKCKYAFQINKLGFEKHFGNIKSQYVTRSHQLLFLSVKLALKDAGIKNYKSENIGVFTSLPHGSRSYMDDFHRKMLLFGPDMVDPMAFPPAIINYAPSCLCIAYQFKGPNIIFSSGINGGIEAVNFATNLIKQGYITTAVVSGVNDLFVEGWMQLSLRNMLWAPLTKKSIGIFDSRRDGFLIGENSSTIILESFAVAGRRKAKIYAEILGGGVSFGKGREDYCRVMREALRNAHLPYKDVDVCILNSNGLKQTDLEEKSALKVLFRERLSQLDILVPKENNGECDGASATLQTLIAAQAMYTQRLPPFSSHKYTGHGQIDGLKIEYQSKRKIMSNILINAFNVDGNNAALVIGGI